MRRLYESVEKILLKLDFDNIWRGFSKFNFALYNDSGVWLKDEVIPYDTRFLGNTSIDYNGEYMAIWRVEEPACEDIELLAANLTHEMFHSFQQKNNENRYPNDLAILDYPFDKENFIVKHSENRILAAAAVSDDIRVKQNLIKVFISARKYREGIIGDIIKQEFYLETVEGMAEYAGCMALKQMSCKKYAERINKYAAILRTLDNCFFDIRRASYYSGALFCILLSETGIDVFHNIGETGLTLFEIVSEGLEAEKPQISFDDKEVCIKAEEYFSDKKKKLKEFTCSHKNITNGDFRICGYDPMNMIKVNNMILCSHFIMLRNENDAEPIFVQGPVVVTLKAGSVYEVKSYLK